MSEMKMSEHFPEAFQVDGNPSFGVQNCVWTTFGEDEHSTADQDSAIEHAVLNHDRMVGEIAEFKLEDKRSFFSGVAVSLQAIAFFGDSAIAEEIVSGLGGDKEEFYEYLKSEGGVDLDTYRYLIKNNTADILSTFDAIECECGCDITQEVMSLNEGQFDCSCGAEISWKEKLNQEGGE